MKRYKGKTAGGWLKKAELAEFGRSGLINICHADLPGCVIEQYGMSCMVIRDSQKIYAVLELSLRALRRLSALNYQASERMGWI